MRERGRPGGERIAQQMLDLRCKWLRFEFRRPTLLIDECANLTASIGRVQHGPSTGLKVCRKGRELQFAYGQQTCQQKILPALRSTHCERAVRHRDRGFFSTVTQSERLGSR